MPGTPVPQRTDQVGALKTGPGRSFEVCAGVRAVFTGRAGGVSADPFGTLNLSYSVGDGRRAVDANRDLVPRLIGPGPERVAWLRQVHGADVAYAAGPPPDEEPQADAVFSDSPSVAVGVLVADCAPVLLADPAARLVGAAHAGRPGLAAGVVPALVAAMSRAGADPGRMRAVIGPAICGQCYEVPARMRDEVAAAAADSACVTRKGTPGIDLRAGLRRQLADLGVGRLADDARCTAESPELFSYRRDGSTGRFAGLIWLTT
ncbi:MAG TPA: peptidoglycan editing factor PgeF [Streptosporangiaceae bacterium]|nr:peptidoglycan editing factor PgeF [Streptosporangiaceae bacterium]